MNSLARICWITAPVYALLGMSFGIHMAISGNYTLAPAHAHLNLLGWVSIAVYGAFYTLLPQAAESTLAKLQVLLAEIGVIVLVPGIAMAILSGSEPLAAIGSIIVLASMLLFLIVVVRATSSAGAKQRLQPAE